MNRSMSAALDRYITGNYGENQFEEMPPSCEDCPEEIYEKCPGQDKCVEVYLDSHPACCLKHRYEMVDGECGSCVADDFREIERESLLFGYGEQDLVQARVRAHWLRAGVSMKTIEEAYIAKRGIKIVNMMSRELFAFAGNVEELVVVQEVE